MMKAMSTLTLPTLHVFRYPAKSTYNLNVSWWLGILSIELHVEKPCFKILHCISHKIVIIFLNVKVVVISELKNALSRNVLD